MNKSYPLMPTQPQKRFNFKRLGETCKTKQTSLFFFHKTRACECYRLCVKDNEVKDAALSDQIIYVETEIPGETAGSYTCSWLCHAFRRNNGCWFQPNNDTNVLRGGSMLKRGTR